MLNITSSWQWRHASAPMPATMLMLGAGCGRPQYGMIANRGDCDGSGPETGGASEGSAVSDYRNHISPSAHQN